MCRPLCFVALLLLVAPTQPATPCSAGTITVDASKPGHAIPSNLYGIFFEEISHAGEGELYAELVQNRGFEDSRLPPMCKLENGFVVPPRTPHFDTGRSNEATPHSLMVEVKATIPVRGNSLAHTFPPYSLSILRLRTPG